MVIDNLIRDDKSISFWHISAQKEYPSIWHLLQQGAWKQLDPVLFERNTLLGDRARAEHLPVIADLLPLYPGMQVYHSGGLSTVKETVFKPEFSSITSRDFLNLTRNYFERFKGKRIGVQLSGGLDSSIIIGLLHHFNIPFYLVGMTTNRFEFRTERHIQQQLAKYAINTVLIDYEQHLPFSDLKNVPPHQNPDLLCINYSANQAMAKACQALGVEVLLTGNGGDNVFASIASSEELAKFWLPYTFPSYWLNDNVYNRCGVAVEAFYGDHSIMNAIYNLRQGQAEDNSKLWARQFFANFLPQELVNYTYCADFWGLYISGLSNVDTDIKYFFNKAFLLTANSSFSPQAYASLFNQDLLNAEKGTYQQLESRIALSVWIYALAKINVV